MEKIIITIIIAVIFIIGGIIYMIIPKSGQEFKDIDDKINNISLLLVLNDTKGYTKTSLNSSQFTISKWDESKFTGYLPTTISTTKSKVGNIDKVTLNNSIYSSEFYMNDSETFEWEIVLTAKPKTNSFSIPIKLENINCYYQPPLNIEYNDFVNCNETDCWGNKIDESFPNRPENIVGSYACYGIKKDNKYQTGKVLHIYRPFITDSNGSSEWCDLNIEKNILNVSCSEKFLADAVYPVIIDPTFGYTTLGATTSQGPSNDWIIRRIGNPGEAGTATSISWGVQVTSSTPAVLWKGALYDASDNLLTPVTAEGSITNTTKHWATANFTNGPSVSNANFRISAIQDYNADNLLRYAYDSGGVLGDSDRFITAGSITYDTFNNPYPAHTDSANLYSVYATYTTGGSPPAGDCWSYDAGTKTLYVPNGCKYYLPSGEQYIP